MTPFVRRLMLPTNSLNRSTCCEGRPSFGSRACRCTIAAPASMAPTAASSISSAVTGRCGDMLGVWIEPVTAQVMMTLFGLGMALPRGRVARSYQ